MNVSELIAILDGQSDLVSVIRTLGTDCVDNRDDVRADDYARQSQRSLDLREIARAESLGMWAADGQFVARPSEEFKKQIGMLECTESVAPIMVLEGICYGAARVYFANASSIVRLERGSVVPFPERWLPKIAETPSPLTMHPNLLDEDCNFVLWERDWVLELDFSDRERLDQVCAIREPKRDKPATKHRAVTKAYSLPKIATVHPFGGDEMATSFSDFERKIFYAVHPKLPEGEFTDEEVTQQISDSHEWVFAALAKVAGQASIAVLPEFSLQAPDGLDALIAATPGLPDLVVAGSAHTDIFNKDIAHMDAGANTSHVFLDRRPILVVSKQQEFFLRLKDHEEEPLTFREYIAPMPRVLRVAAGTATRLAIAICSDLNSGPLVEAMSWAGVNLLLSPSWTPRVAGFAGKLTDLASSCQCIGVVANTPGHAKAGRDDPPPFWAYSVVPREPCQGRDHYYNGNTPAVGVLDPNEPLDNRDEYWKWLT